jgi:ElaB/YqjD/DUF883 family membrane-anchored ribosome-binding protein
MGLMDTIKGWFGKAKDVAGDVGETMGDVAEKAGDVAGDAFDSVKDKAGDVVDSVKDKFDGDDDDASEGSGGA